MHRAFSIVLALALSGCDEGPSEAPDTSDDTDEFSEPDTAECLTNCGAGPLECVDGTTIVEPVWGHIPCRYSCDVARTYACEHGCDPELRVPYTDYLYSQEPLSLHCSEPSGALGSPCESDDECLPGACTDRVCSSATSTCTIDGFTSEPGYAFPEARRFHAQLHHVESLGLEPSTATDEWFVPRDVRSCAAIVLEEQAGDDWVYVPTRSFDVPACTCTGCDAQTQVEDTWAVSGYRTLHLWGDERKVRMVSSVIECCGTDEDHVATTRPIHEELVPGHSYRVRVALVHNEAREGWTCERNLCTDVVTLDTTALRDVPQPCDADAWVVSAPTVYEVGYELWFRSPL